MEEGERREGKHGAVEGGRQAESLEEEENRGSGCAFVMCGKWK